MKSIHIILSACDKEQLYNLYNSLYKHFDLTISHIKNPSEAQDYEQPPIEAIKTSELIVFLLTENSNKSTEAYRQVAFAINNNKKILTLNINHIIPTPEIQYYTGLTQSISISSDDIIHNSDWLAQKIFSVLKPSNSVQSIAKTEPTTTHSKETSLRLNLFQTNKKTNKLIAGIIFNFRVQGYGYLSEDVDILTLENILKVGGKIWVRLLLFILLMTFTAIMFLIIFVGTEKVKNEGLVQLYRLGIALCIPIYFTHHFASSLHNGIRLYRDIHFYRVLIYEKRERSIERFSILKGKSVKEVSRNFEELQELGFFKEFKILQSSKSTILVDGIFDNQQP